MANRTKKQVTPEEGGGLAGSLMKGLRIVEHLVDAPTPQGLSEIASAAAIDNSTAHRLLQTLVESGYIVRDEASRRYTAGPKALAPIGVTHPLSELSHEATPILGSLRNSTGQTSSLVLFLGTQRLVVEAAKGAQPLVPYYERWLRSPLHGSASGKVLLASLTPQERASLLGEGPYQGITPHTTTDPAELAEQLERVRERGFAVARDDAFVGMTAIAAPLKYLGRTIGCLAITGRSDAVTADDDEAHGTSLANAASLLGSSAPSLRSVFYMLSYRGPVAAT